MEKNRFLLVAGIPDSLISFRGALIDEMLARFREVHVAAPDFDSVPGVKAALREKGVFLHEVAVARTGMNPFADIRSLISYVLVIRRAKPDMMLTYTAKAVIYGSIGGRFCGVPRSFALISGLGFLFQARQEPLYRIVTAVARYLYHIGLAGIDCAIFQNPDDEEELRTSGVLPERTPSAVVRGSGVDCEYYSPQPFPVDLHFLMIARLLRQKGVREYVEAARLVKQFHPQVSFTLLGWRDDNPDAVDEYEVNSWKEAGHVVFIDRCEDVRPYVTNCSVYVLPSYREGTPRTVLEAMAMGRPIVTTDVPGCRETVEEGENGFLVEAGSPTSLVSALLKFVDNRSLVEQMGRKSRAIAEAEFEVDKVNASMLDAMGLDSPGKRSNVGHGLERK